MSLNNMKTLFMKAKVLALRDVEIQMYKILEKGQIISFDNVKEKLVALEGLYKSEVNLPKEKKCEFGHSCTGACQETVECPCVNEHYCSMSGEHSEMDCADQEEGCPQHPKEDNASFINDNINER